MNNIDGNLCDMKTEFNGGTYMEKMKHDSSTIAWNNLGEEWFELAQKGESRMCFIMPEAVKRVIEFCFEEEKYDYLMCSHAITNNQSKRVIEKSGFRFVKENTRITKNGKEHISLYYVLDNSEAANGSWMDGAR